MEIPIDLRKYVYPIRDKYLIDETPLLQHWMEFGIYPDGRVDIASVDGDVFLAVPKDVAEKILEARGEFCEKIVDLINQALQR